MNRLGRSALAAALALVAFSGTASGHVEYVADGTGETVDPVAYVLSVLAEPLNAALVGGGALAIVAVVGAYIWRGPFERDRAALHEALGEYDAYLPWMLRLAIGLPLVGAGFAGYFFSPAVPVEARVLQAGLGFLLLFGLATRAAAVVGLVLFVAGVAVYPDLLLAFEFVGGLAAIALLGSGRPSADHLLQRVAEAPRTFYGRLDPVHRLADRLNRRSARLEAYLPVVVRVPLGFTFALLGVREKLAAPERALQVVDAYDLTAIVPVDPGLWVVGAGLVELGVGLALLLGAFTRSAAAVAFLTLTLTLFGLHDDPVLAHVSLFGLTSALVVTGGGPLSIDRWLEDRRQKREGGS